MTLLDIVLGVELGILSTFVTVGVLVVLCEWVDSKLPKPPPYCDVDPLCHPSFAWAADGTGWIGNVCVVKK